VWEKCSFLLRLKDFAKGSVQDAVTRYGEMHNPPFGATFIAADCFEVDLPAHMPPWVWFDLVSCQFALHYSFSTEARARRFLANVAGRLKPGGHFVATFPHANRIVYMRAVFCGMR